LLKRSGGASYSVLILLFLLRLKTRKIISVFLLLVLCAQLLPLKQTISWLLSGTATEEISHANNPGSNRAGDNWQKDFLPVSFPTLELYSHIRSTSLHALTSLALPLRHADDIPTPPPNC
jgi:hypothetical protein